jgi:hypothetical protein
MGLFEKLSGWMPSFVQWGGPAGPGVNQNGTALETRNAANNAYANHRGALPLVDADFATKAYVDTIARPFIVTAQSNAATALIANSATEHYIVVSAAGSSAAAAYVAGAILWDDGSSSGNVTILGPTAGQPIFTTVALTGGAFVFSANNEYIWTGSTWSNVAPSIAGAGLWIQVTIGLATVSSVTSIPANAVVTRVVTSVSTAYSAGATISVGQTGTVALLQATSDIVPQTIDSYGSSLPVAWGGSALPVLITIAGSPAVGAGTVLVQYTSPQS